MILVTSIDDIYDIYGSMEELEKFTKGVERWSMDAMEKLPECLKLCFQSLIRVINEISYVNFKEHGVDTRSHLKKVWTDLCKSFLLEAKWHYTKFTPSFKGYMDNAWISSSGVVLLLHAYCLISPNITKEALDCFDQHKDLIYHPSLIFRLCNDLVPSTMNLEGDETAKSIPCYMHETGHSEKLAQEYMKNMIEERWKKMNRCQVGNTRFPQSFIDVILNLIKTVHCVYQYGDAYGSPNKASTKRVLKVLIEPISLHKNI
ncbi:lysase [Sarracenia purpurea var. burkii]